ncbi:hypothetical protein MW887_002831 [Aspergillus wentii]|nr:hypothetical protein MW887_002831 [Aspergillus wentii]
MPILWPQALRASNSKYDSHSTQSVLLPPSISGSWDGIPKNRGGHEYDTFHQNLLPQQEKRLHDAWSTVVSVFPDTDWDTFAYHWLIVNTRSFFYLMPGDEAPEDRNDAMALLPFADYFNHSDVACNVNFDGANYVFRATKNYEQGEEIYMSYGAHPNDFLFAEYFDASQHEELDLQQYYGNYQLTATGACFRTEIAACIKYMTRRDWRNYVLGHSMKGVDDNKTQATIQEWIKIYAKEADRKIATLEAMKSSGENQIHSGKIDMLLKRWKQIKHLCDEALKADSC